MNKSTNISERITQVIDYLKVNPNSFAKKLGYERSQALYDIINGKSKPSFDFFHKLYSSEYSESINMEWLVTGKGDMIPSPIPTAIADPTAIAVEFNDTFWKKKARSLEISLDLMAQEIERLRKM